MKTATVNEFALQSQFSPLVGTDVSIKKEGKNKSQIFVFGHITSIPNNYLTIKE